MLDHCSFHGRGFFPGGIALDDPLLILAAFGAFVGLLIARHLDRRPHSAPVRQGGNLGEMTDD